MVVRVSTWDGFDLESSHLLLSVFTSPCMPILLTSRYIRNSSLLRLNAISAPRSSAANSQISAWFILISLRMRPRQNDSVLPPSHYLDIFLLGVP